jgi:hydrogenase nickel incorporation protein HypA/HybF
MHESSLAKNVLDAVLARARAERAERVLVARGWLADVEAIDPESLAFHFAAHARGTIAEGARLEIARTLVKARCLDCRAEFEPDHHVALCPSCGGEGELERPTGLGIEELEVS